MKWDVFRQLRTEDTWGRERDIEASGPEEAIGIAAKEHWPDHFFPLETFAVPSLNGHEEYSPKVYRLMSHIPERPDRVLSFETTKQDQYGRFL